VVDDSEIKEDCVAIHLGPLGEQEIVTANGECKLDKKIIAHLPLNESPILEGVALLPPLEQEDDVEGLAKTQWGNVHRTGVLGYIDGYNKAKEKYKYTEEDVLRIIDMAKEEININPSCDDNMWVAKYSKDEIIQFLSQPKIPVGFECEESVFFATNAFSSDITLTSEGLQDTVLKGIKTTTNSQGQTQWVGKYIY
jgi:hypothetical protein